MTWINGCPESKIYLGRRQHAISGVQDLSWTSSTRNTQLCINASSTTDDVDKRMSGVQDLSWTSSTRNTQLCIDASSTTDDGDKRMSGVQDLSWTSSIRQLRSPIFILDGF
jgi:hypothetical protein